MATNEYGFDHHYFRRKPKRMAKASFEKLIKENIEWLRKQPETLERTHIEAILADSVNQYYSE